MENKHVVGNVEIKSPTPPKKTISLRSKDLMGREIKEGWGEGRGRDNASPRPHFSIREKKEKKRQEKIKKKVV
jgi:hypothetical protein